MLKKLSLISILLIFSALLCGAAEKKVHWSSGVEASSLNLIGKSVETANPYHRVDTVKYKGFNKTENFECRMSAGLAVLFRTNATDIGVVLELGEVRNYDFPSYTGVDLYVKKDGEFLWAGRAFANHNYKGGVMSVVNDMAPGEKECILYLPLFSEVNSCKICVTEGASIEPLDSPFRHKIVFHGSSFTHGHSCTRSGMSYPMQWMRRTGMQVIPLGFSGRCMMQPYFADFLCDVEADAYVFDSFSNPQAPTIKARLFPFIEKLQAAHPGKPLIFQRTIYWEKDNFNTVHNAETLSKQAMSDSLMSIACRKYKDVYYIVPDAALHNGESSTADGVHPNDNGYSVWEKSIEKPLLRILGWYGIR